MMSCNLQLCVDGTLRAHGGAVTEADVSKFKSQVIHQYAAAFEALPAVRVDLQNIKLHDEIFAILITCFLRATRLRVLDLSNNLLSDVSADILTSAFVCFPALRTVCVAYNHFTSKTCVALARAFFPRSANTDARRERVRRQRSLERICCRPPPETNNNADAIKSDDAQIYDNTGIDANTHTSNKDIYGDKLEDVEIEPNDFEDIWTFDISGNRLDDEGCIEILKTVRDSGCTARLSMCDVSVTAAILPYIMECGNYLSGLDISHNSLCVNNDNNADICALLECQSLRELRIASIHEVRPNGETNATSQNVNANSNLPPKNRLENIIRLSKAPVNRFDPMTYKKSDYSAIPTDLIAHISKRMTFSSLKSLSLTGNHMSDASFTTLCQGLKSHNCHLIELDVSYNRITSCTALVEVLEMNKLLSFLELSHNHISELSFMQLFEGIASNKQVLELSLAGNHIGVDATRALLKCIHIQTSTNKIASSANSHSHTALVHPKGYEDADNKMLDKIQTAKLVSPFQDSPSSAKHLGQQSLTYTPPPEYVYQRYHKRLCRRLAILGLGYLRDSPTAYHHSYDTFNVSTQGLTFIDLSHMKLSKSDIGRLSEMLCEEGCRVQYLDVTACGLPSDDLTGLQLAETARSQPAKVGEVQTAPLYVKGLPPCVIHLPLQDTCLDSSEEESQIDCSNTGQSLPSYEVLGQADPVDFYRRDFESSSQATKLNGASRK